METFLLLSLLSFVIYLTVKLQELPRLHSSSQGNRGFFSKDIHWYLLESPMLLTEICRNH